MKRALKGIFHVLFEFFFARLLMRAASLDNIGHVLISGYTGLGHFILRTAFIKKFEELYPRCRVTIIAGNSFGTESVLKGYPTLILRQESSELAKALFFLRLRKMKIDVAFFFFDSSPAFLIRGTILAAIPIRVGHVFDHVPIPSYYYTTKVPVKMGGVRSEIDLNLDLLEALYGKSFRREYRPFIEMNGDTRILEVNGLQKDGYICLQMGASNGLPCPKRWLESHYRELILRLLGSYPHLGIVALGDIGDSNIVNRICESISSERLEDLSGRTTLEETKTLISFSKFLICHDSGLLHLGNALGRNVIALYGPSDPDVYAVNTPTCHILQKPCDCTPKLGLFPGMFSQPTEAEAALKCPVPKCMERLTVEEVYAKCIELLNGPATDFNTKECVN